MSSFVPELAQIHGYSAGEAHYKRPWDQAAPLAHERGEREREITSTDAGSHGRLEPGGIANPQTTQRRRPLPDLVGFGSFRNALHYYCSKEEDGVKWCWGSGNKWARHGKARDEESGRQQQRARGRPRFDSGARLVAVQGTEGDGIGMGKNREVNHFRIFFWIETISE
jgi:hypothetical protein